LNCRTSTLLEEGSILALEAPSQLLVVVVEVVLLKMLNLTDPYLMVVKIMDSLNKKVRMMSTTMNMMTSTRMKKTVHFKVRVPLLFA
jgi:hypothetical protein